MRRPVTPFAALVCAGLTASPAHADIFAIDFFGTRYTINNTTLAVTSTGSHPGFLNSLTRNAAGTVYYSLDDGPAGHILNYSTATTNWTNGPLITPTIGNETDIRGLAFRPSNGLLYGIEDHGFGGFASDLLVTINPTTGAWSSVGLTGVTGIQSLEISPAGTTLYAWDATRGLMTVNMTTGVATDVNVSVVGPFMQTLAFDSDGTLFGISSDTDKLYAINTTTGATTLVGGSGFTDVRGMVITGVVPVP